MGLSAKWMVNLMENPLEMNDLGVLPFQETILVCVFPLNNDLKCSFRENYRSYDHETGTFQTNLPILMLSGISRVRSWFPGAWHGFQSSNGEVGWGRRMLAMAIWLFQWGLHQRGAQ